MRLVSGPRPAAVVRSALGGLPRQQRPSSYVYPSIASSRPLSSNLHPPRQHPPSHPTARYHQSAQHRRPSSTMSSQPAHPTLLIPGPIEFDDAVLQSMGHYRCVASALAAPILHSVLTGDSQREPRRCRLRRHLWRDPHPAAPALPDDQPRVAALRHQRLGHPRLGPRRRQPRRAR